MISNKLWESSVLAIVTDAVTEQLFYPDEKGLSQDGMTVQIEASTKADMTEQIVSSVLHEYNGHLVSRWYN